MSDTEIQKASAKANEAGLVAKKFAEEDPSYLRSVFRVSGDIPDEALALYVQYETEATTFEREAIYARERLESFAERAGIVIEKDSAQLDGGIGQKESGTVASLISLFKSGAQLALDPVPETTYIIDKLLPEGAVVQITGAPKGGGKTTFTLGGLAAVRRGGDFLGGPTISTPVVFLTEQSRANFEAEYLEPAGLMGDDGFHVLYRWETRHFDWETIVAGAVEKCRLEGAKILVIDTFISWAKPRDENDAPVMEALLSILQDAAAEGFTVIVIHHARKGGGDAIEAGRGSSAFAAAVDVIINIRRTPGAGPSTVRELRCEGRYGGLYASLMIELVDGQYVAHGSRADVSQHKAEEAVKDALPTSEGDAITMGELVKALEPQSVGRTACQRALDKLINTGQAANIGDGKRANPYRYFVPLEQRMNGSASPEPESAEVTEKVSAQLDIPIGRKENGVSGQGLIWARGEEGQE